MMKPNSINCELVGFIFTQNKWLIPVKPDDILYGVHLVGNNMAKLFNWLVSWVSV